MSGEPAGDADSRIVLGEIVGAHGIRGELKLHSWTRPRENILDYPVWILEKAGSTGEYELAGGRHQGKGLVARLAGVEDRDAAAALQGSRISVPRSALPDKAPGEYYWAELEGLAVETLTGQSLGKVTGLIETGANDVLVVEGERERLIPYAPGVYIQSVDLTSGRIVVDWDPEF
ncbi:ribosome maturation factor RimM [Spiribacter insolitus]|uniref:Ribosome maturation factor RimM n=1 Tax=Spiribacter insolitus TaxID=3122417 RepID=A0ABV3T601_9GAMM